ncbi:PREDICTED: monocarboxylate transporter 10-like [Acropora digitifera]|uniref:monocarboxylate transporter 10-like n=1 Tax=Acropora digitifera TaxID=70779 RepID=UPI00077A0757|nr:PREDICTED: monocarboxylate transporter 10-like [Acropora digitifera]
MSSNDKDDALISQNNRTDLENSRAICDKQPDPDSQPNCSTFAEPMKQAGLTNPEKEIIKHETEENTTTAHITSQASSNNQPHLKSKASGKDFQGDNEDQNSKESSHKHDDPSTKNPHPDEEAELNTRNHYDAGWAWFVCGTTFLMEFFVGGMITSSGVIYAALLAEFKKSRAETAWVSSLAVSTYYLFFPLGAFLSERYGCWVVSLVGNLACFVGLLSSSFVTSLPLLYLTYGTVWGIGASFMYFANLLILTRHFKARLAFANGIMALGGAVGGSVLNPTMQQLVIHLGLANMFRVLSVAFLLLSGFSVVYRPRRNGKPQDDVAQPEKKPAFAWEILENKTFLMWIAVVFIFMLGYMVPFVHLVRLAEDIGIDKTRASFLLTFVTVGSGLGRVTFGRISDVQRLNRIYIVQVAFLVVGLSNFVVPMTESYVVLAGDAFIFGFFGACYLVLNPVIVCDILGPDKVSYGLGLIFFVIAIPRTVGPLIAGWIFDGLQSYAIAFYTLGATTCVSSIFIFFLTILMRRKGGFDIREVAERQSHLNVESDVPIVITAFKSLRQ